MMDETNREEVSRCLLLSAASLLEHPTWLSDGCLLVPQLVAGPDCGALVWDPIRVPHFITHEAAKAVALDLGVLENVLHGLDGSCSKRLILVYLAPTAIFSNLSIDPSPRGAMRDQSCSSCSITMLVIRG